MYIYDLSEQKNDFQLSIKIDTLIILSTYYILKNWKTVRKDDINTIICSLRTIEY
jgi:hypothetical protein